MAREYQDKSNVGAAPDSIIATKHGGGEITSKQKEIANACRPTGQTLAPADGTAEKFNQVAQALFINATGAQTFQDSGAADAYVVTPVTGASGLVVPDDYDNMNGAMISFIPSAVPTGASTLDLGQTAGTLLGTKKILDLAGAALVGGEFNTTNYHEFRYDTAADAATGAWLFIGIKRPASATINAYGKWSETQPSGTDGGTFTQDVWQTRDLNTEDSDTDNLGTIVPASKQLTLEAGTYIVAGSAFGFDVGKHTARLYDTTGAAVLAGVKGTTEVPSGGSVGTHSHISGKFTIAVQSVIELQDYCTSTQATNGFGLAATIASTPEVYATIELWRVS